MIYPIWDGLRASLTSFRYGKAVGFVGLQNYTRLLSDPQFLNSLWVTLKFVTLAVSLETLLGLSLALFFLREFPGIRLMRTVLIIPMVITPVVVAILFSPDLRQRRRHVHRDLARLWRRQRADPQRSGQRVPWPRRARRVGMDAADVPDPAGRAAEPATGAARSRPRRRRRANGWCCGTTPCRCSSRSSPSPSSCE